MTEADKINRHHRIIAFTWTVCCIAIVQVREYLKYIIHLLLIKDTNGYDTKTSDHKSKHSE